jgi:hypothetical protein
MKRRLEQFYVPAGFIKEFAVLIQLHNLNNIIVGVEHDDIIVFVNYLSGQQKIIDSFHKKINEFDPNRKPQHTEVEAFYVPMAFVSSVVGFISKYNLKNSLGGRYVSISGEYIIIIVNYEIDQQSIIDMIAKQIQNYEKHQKDDRWRMNGIDR